MSQVRHRGELSVKRGKNRKKNSLVIFIIIKNPNWCIEILDKWFLME